MQSVRTLGCSLFSLDIGCWAADRSAAIKTWKLITLEAPKILDFFFSLFESLFKEQHLDIKI